MVYVCEVLLGGSMCCNDPPALQAPGIVSSTQQSSASSQQLHAPPLPPIIISKYYPKHLLFTSLLPPGIGEAGCQSGGSPLLGSAAVIRDKKTIGGKGEHGGDGGGDAAGRGGALHPENLQTEEPL